MISVASDEDRGDRATVSEIRPETERVLHAGDELQRARLDEADHDEHDHDRPEERA